MMKTVFKFLKYPLLAAFLVTAVSCNNDDDNNGNVPEEQNIVELAVATPQLSNLVAALQQANLVSALEGAGPFTVFAPTNEAFNAFLADNGFASLSEVPNDVLTDILLNHVVAGSFRSNQLTTGYIQSESTAGAGDRKLSMFINTSGGVSINGVSDVTTPDIEATNGIVHIVDAVIGLPTIVTHAVANSNLSSLVSALTAGGNTTFTNLLSSAGPFTVFAPVNDAFAAFTNPNGNDIAAILSNHVVVGAAAFSNGLSNTYVNTAATFEPNEFLSLYINVDSGVTLNGSSNVVAADIVATNGVIHAVDAVIDLPTVVTFATADPTFSSLVSALTAEGQPDFVGILSGDGPFTVFAPTNDAFAALPAVPSGAALTSVLQHHVLNGNVRSGDLSNGLMAPTLEGDNITVTLPGTGGNIANLTDGSGNNDIGVIVVDVQAANGVVHVINKVLIPDTTN